jgi:hypothetical protein
VIIEEQSKERQLLERFRLALETEEDKKAFESVDLYFHLGLQVERRDALDKEHKAEVIRLKNKIDELNEEIRTLKVLRDLAEKTLRLEEY